MQVLQAEDRKEKGGSREVPHADEHVAVAEDEQQDVLLGHVVEVGVLLVGEEQIGFPQALEHFGVHRQRVGLEVCWQAQPRVVPALPQEDVHAVILDRPGHECREGERIICIFLNGSK